VRYKPLREGAELHVGIGLATPRDRPELRAFLRRIVAAPS
jgi:hypothetical protein